MLIEDKADQERQRLVFEELVGSGVAGEGQLHADEGTPSTRASHGHSTASALRRSSVSGGALTSSRATHSAGVKRRWSALGSQ